LGELLAKMHVQNDRLRTKMENAESSIHEKAAPDSNGSTVEPIRQFGFSCNTCCGAIPHNNDWCDDWQAFFTRQRLQYQIDLLEKERGDREVISLWPQLQQKIPKILKDVDAKPALLHGDLWAGNASETPDGPVVFDCATFYGHSEYDLAIASMFGGFTREFFTSYHKIIPKAPGFDERLKLYQLFHYLNHWNHFGNGYRGSSLAIMRKLVK
jgi:fructosamine-3-kinase